MFAPTRTWRRWHRKVNVNQKRFAVASALAASAIAPLVQARGHRIDGVPEIPLVLANEAVDTLEKTKKAFALLKVIGAADDVLKVKLNKKVRAGKGKYRNRRYVLKRGPLIVHSTSGVNLLTRAFRNLPGIEFARVQELNPLLLSPGGHIGRFIIWTKAAFELLDTIWGTQRTASKLKIDYRLPRSILSSDDISHIINSDQVQNILRLKKGQKHSKLPIKNNPFVHKYALDKLNPHAPEVRAQEKAKHAKIFAQKEARRAEKKAGTFKKPAKKVRTEKPVKRADVRKHLFGSK